MIPFFFKILDHFHYHHSEFFIRWIPYLFLCCLVWWAFILILYLLGIPLSLNLVYIAVFGVAFLYSGSWWFLFIVEVPHCGWGCMGGLSRFPGREACAGVLVGGAGFLLSGVQ